MGKRGREAEAGVATAADRAARLPGAGGGGLAGVAGNRRGEGEAGALTWQTRNTS